MATRGAGRQPPNPSAPAGIRDDVHRRFLTVLARAERRAQDEFARTVPQARRRRDWVGRGLGAGKPDGSLEADAS